MKNNFKNFEYNEMTMSEDRLDKEEIEQLKNEGMSEESIFDLALDYFKEDDGNIFAEAGISKGVVQGSETIFDALVSAMAQDDITLIKDFRDYVKAEGGEIVRLEYDEAKDTFFSIGNMGVKTQVLTLSDNQLEVLKYIKYMADQEDYKFFNINEYTIWKDDFEYFKLIVQVEKEYLNIPNVEKKLLHIISEYEGREFKWV